MERKSISCVVFFIEELNPSCEILVVSSKLINLSFLYFKVRGDIFLNFSFLVELIICVQFIFDEVWGLNACSNEDFLSSNFV